MRLPTGQSCHWRCFRQPLPLQKLPVLNTLKASSRSSRAGLSFTRRLCESVPSKLFIPGPEKNRRCAFPFVPSAGKLNCAGSKTMGIAPRIQYTTCRSGYIYDKLSPILSRRPGSAANQLGVALRPFLEMKARHTRKLINRSLVLLLSQIHTKVFGSAHFV